ncbi:amino acid ABC transporter substrate-binding protein [Trichocoleus sp. FACHB-591]|uniref:ABC transporter substrate-binding protein n=1 Tax=Trichocoleus sp. FACHB-591 TaxID=2692872 RepID=UPI0016882556|nr:ABC transporter substrate-binding protein [Trichocoleus sp. FACHB-591]MBD2096505.1 amino acid ABC transporter substrate-binding protein [Trichocoleus sp. FACHB-591]
MTSTQKRNSTSVRPKASVPPIVLLLIGLGVVTGISWLKGNIFSPSSQSLNAGALKDRMSLGNQLLIEADATPEKRAGVAAFAKGDFEGAIAQFEASLRKRQNDPETLIYLNNARVDDTALRIAVGVPIGSNLNVAQEMLRGVAQAQDEVNRNGGIDGVPLQVEIVNDENNPEIVKQVATELVKDSRILAVVGHNASNASLVAAPIYQQGQLVMVTPTSFANNLSGFGSYVFRAVPTTRLMAEPLAQYVVGTTRKTNIAVCYDSQAPDNVSFKDEFVAALVAQGGKLVPTVCDFSTPNFNPTTAIAQAVSSGAEGLLVSPHIDRLDRAIELARANQGRLALLGSPTLYTIKTPQSGQADMNGLVLPVPWHPTAFADHPFAVNAKYRWGGAVNWRTAMTYDASRAIIKGLEQDKTRSGLQNVLRSPAFSASGAGDPVKFLPSGDRLGQAVLVQIQPSASGYDFAPLRP